MTVELRDLLVHQADSALSATPSEPPGDLWSQGRRRRTRRRLTVTAASVAAIAAVGGGVARLTAYERGPAPPATSIEHTDARALGYPERITGIDDGDAAPGPVSGIAWAPAPTSAGGEPNRTGTYAVLPSGRMQWLAGIGDTARAVRVSPNGRFAADTDGESYQLLDLATGRPVDLGHPATQRPDLETQMVWSPDSRWVYLPLTGEPRDGFAMALAGVVVDTDGHSFGIPRGNVTLVGFVRQRLLGVGYLSDRRNYALQIYDPTWLGGGWQDTGVTLESTGTRPGPEFVIGSASLSPDGTRLALRSAPTAPGNPTDVRIFDVANGALIPDVNAPTADSHIPEIPVQADDNCPLAWQQNRLLVPWKSDRTFATSTTLAGVAGDPVVVANPALDLTCVDWADDALAGERHTAFYGLQDTWISWHPRTVLPLLGGTLGLLGWLAAQNRLRRRRPRDLLSV